MYFLCATWGFLTKTTNWEIHDLSIGGYYYRCLPYPSLLVTHHYYEQQHSVSTDLRGITVLGLCFDLNGAIKQMIIHLQT